MLQFDFVYYYYFAPQRKKERAAIPSDWDISGFDRVIGG